MKNKIGTIKIFLIASVLLMLASCEKVFLENDPPHDPLAVFDYLWDDINSRYSFFEFKQIDWEAARVKYRPQVTEGISDTRLFDLLSDMLNELEDGHVNLTSNFNRSRNWDWYLNYPINYNHDIIERKYLGKKFRITGPFYNQTIDSILYVNYRSFGDQLTNSHLNELMEFAEGLKGVIIDVRHNGGGKLDNAYRIASCFADTTYAFATSRIKTGPGPDDFSPWKTMQVEPRSGQKFTGKVVVLINRKSYSASTFFAQMTKSLPNAVLMGDKTGGGGGVPAYGELPNGWKYRFSATQTLDLDGKHIEPGVVEDITVALSEKDESMGFDTIIEAALSYLQ